MPKIRFENIEQAKRYRDKIIGRQNIEGNKFVKYCHQSNIWVCPKCFGFNTKAVGRYDSGHVKMKCDCGNTFSGKGE